MCLLFGHNLGPVADEKGQRDYCDRCKTDFVGGREIIYKHLNK